MDYNNEDYEISRLEGEGGVCLNPHESKRLGIARPEISEIIDIYGPVANISGRQAYYGKDKDGDYIVGAVYTRDTEGAITTNKDGDYIVGAPATPNEIKEHGEIKWERYISDTEVPREFKSGTSRKRN